MKELVVLGFASRELAEEARSRGTELGREGVLQLDGAALAYRRDDGRVELVQPMRLALVGAASGAAAVGCWGCCCWSPCCSPPSAPSPRPPARGCPRSGSTSGSSASSTRPLSPAVRHCSSSSATPTPLAAIQALAARSGAAHHPARRRRAAPPRRLDRHRSAGGLGVASHQPVTDRPRGAGLPWSRHAWRSGERLPAVPQVGRRAAEQPHQVGDRDIQPLARRVPGRPAAERLRRRRHPRPPWPRTPRCWRSPAAGPADTTGP